MMLFFARHQYVPFAVPSAGQAVFGFVVIQAVITECFNTLLLFFIKGIVLNIGFDAFLLQDPVVLVRTLAGIGNNRFG
ncbi:MAG: hypothetical protein JWQ54_3298 [Mucilaginibacter sp.]|nr:hypothetical protein [Mucilaginibacter sp.]